MALIFRLVQALVLFVLISGLIYLVVVAVRRIIQGVAKGMGYELSEFGIWIRSLLPKRKKKKSK